jgi:galactokinase
MDQMASVLGAIILLDCRSLAADLIALPEELSIVILDSGIPRGLSQSAYNERRGQCEDGVARMQKRWPDIRALRDATSRMLHDASDLLPERVARRCRHVVTENERVLEAAEALRDGDARRFGARMWQSHESMRDDYEISLPEIDRLVERAMATEGCFGARLTGAGFGGAVVALVQTKCAQEFASAVIAGYNEETSRKGAAILVSADVGARIEAR